MQRREPRVPAEIAEERVPRRFSASSAAIAGAVPTIKADLGRRTIERPIRFRCRGRSGRRQVDRGEMSESLAKGRIPRISRLMALAIRFDDLIRAGHITNYAELARLGQVTRNRVSQIINLLLLAPDLQEELLFLPRVESGEDPVYLKDLQVVAKQASWATQREGILHRLPACVL